MDTRFDFKNEEGKIYEEWERNGYFKPDYEDGQTRRSVPTKKSFCIILPPPNANADLHLGHAMYVIEDIMVRYHRMKGDSTLWLPGADHAGFETQFVYEKHLAKLGKSRFDFDRETLFKDIWDFVQKNRGIMENQLKRLGFSLDWSRRKFTLDPEIKKIVYQTFKKMYDDGLIYRGERLVNYCTRCGTSFSDLEVEHVEQKDPLYYIKYGPFILATVRPETKFGDTAVAVNPKDKRYQKWIGKEIEIEGLLGKFKIKVIGDDAIDPNFGTGVAKVTPFHDTTDFEIGKRHNLEKKLVIGFNGKLTDIAGPYAGLSVKIARQKVAEDMQKKGLIEKIDENYIHTVSTCYKCGRVLEPLPLPQWFVKVKPLVEPAIKAIEKNEIKFYPESKKDFALQWLNNFYDWNISRQVVWGMRIPAWQCLYCEKNQKSIRSTSSGQEIKNQNEDEKNQQWNNGAMEQWIITDGEKPEKCPKCGNTDLTQDTDSFDTWFSSSQWPYATLMSGGNSKFEIRNSKKDIRENPLVIRENPNIDQSDDFKRFYPNSVMETGYDILPIWVCRMIFMGIYKTGKIPFKNVYLHGLVRDGKGQKMSKSKGNVVNPLEMIDKYGADALRTALIFGIGQGADVPFSEDKVRAMRNFVTKIWNIARFITLEFEKDNAKDTPFYNSSMNLQNPDDKSIITELKNILTDVNVSMENYEFTRVFNLIYEFVWHSFADIYIEKIKQRLKENDQECLMVARHVFLNCLKILHPFMPFVTEALWKQMPRKSDEMLIVSKWPEVQINADRSR